MEDAKRKKMAKAKKLMEEMERLRAGAEVVATVVRTALGVVVRVKRAREASDEGGSRVVRARC